MSARSTELFTDTDSPVEATLDSLEPASRNGPKNQIWRRLEELEDERRLRSELADLDDLDIESLDDVRKTN